MKFTLIPTDFKILNSTVKFVPHTIDRIRSLFFGGICSYVTVLGVVFVLTEGHVKAYSCRGNEFSVTK